MAAHPGWDACLQKAKEATTEKETPLVPVSAVPCGQLSWGLCTHPSSATLTPLVVAGSRDQALCLECSPNRLYSYPSFEAMFTDHRLHPAFLHPRDPQI